jgi:hypothetical protein
LHSTLVTATSKASDGLRWGLRSEQEVKNKSTRSRITKVNSNTADLARIGTSSKRDQDADDSRSYMLNYFYKISGTYMLSLLDNLDNAPAVDDALDGV